LRLAAGLDRAMVEYARQDPSIAPLGIGLEAIEVPGDVLAAVTDGLGSEVEKVLIQSDLTAVATGPTAPPDHHLLRRYAVAAALGQGTACRIPAAPIDARTPSGLSLADVLGELAASSGEALPSTLAFLVNSSATKLRRVRVAGARAGPLVDDPAGLAVILSD